ncbi:MAG TPA: aldose epimerase family protein [Nocardioides sp.]|nr:aldose epimerase family protein [Nocardioides sp.]
MPQATTDVPPGGAGRRPSGARPFGAMPDGREVTLHRIGVAPGPVAEVLDLGATLHRLEIRGGDGMVRNVVLSHPSVESRLLSPFYLGGTIGRYANRIARGRFELDGADVQVRTHDRGNALHGGPDGFDRRLWEVVSRSASSIELALTSPDGDQGYPGTLRARARYEVVDDGSPGWLRATYSATADAPTVVNLTNHAYVNLDGEGSGPVDDHTLQVRASRYTPVDPDGIPVGDHAPVDGTPFDLRESRAVGVVVRDPHPEIEGFGGIDHNFVLDPGRPGALGLAAVLRSARSRTFLELHTDQPGLQVHTGNGFDGTAVGPSGRAYDRWHGIALEPQLHPDTPHHPDWPTAVLRPGQTYVSTIEWRFLHD